MSITVACACGARFEVQDQSAGKMVECPKCEEPTRAGRSTEIPVRTSNLALTSLIVALGGGFLFAVSLSSLYLYGPQLTTPTAIFLLITPLAPLLSILMAITSFLEIRRSEGALKGGSYSVAAIATSFLFVGLSVLLVVQHGAAIEMLQEHLMSGRVKFDGELQKINSRDAYSIKRPNRKWGVSTAEHLSETGNSGFTLVHPSKKLVIQVSVVNRFAEERTSTDDLRRILYDKMGIERDRFNPGRGSSGDWTNVRKYRDHKILQDLPTIKAVEFILEGTYSPRFTGERTTNRQRRAIVRMVASRGRIYEIWAICAAETFDDNEAELRKVLDTFEVLPEAWMEQ